MELLYSFVIIFLTSSGQIFLKKGVVYREERTISLKFIGLGYLMFSMTIIFSYILMKIIEMKYFTIIMNLNYIAVMFGAHIFLNEKLTQRKIIGTMIVTLGAMVFIYGK